MIEYLKRQLGPVRRLHMVTYFDMEESRDKVGYQGHDGEKAKDTYSELVTKARMVGEDVGYVEWHIDGRRYK